MSKPEFTSTEPSFSEPARSWQEDEVAIYFSVTSDGTTGEDWITRLESKGFFVGAEQVLSSPDFKPTSGVTTNVAVLKRGLFEDKYLTTKKIRAEANNRNFEKPNPELACLIREKFTDGEIKQMGLCYIAAMHEPVNGSDGNPYLLFVYGDGCGESWLEMYCDGPEEKWDSGWGFAFIVSQVGT